MKKLQKRSGSLLLALLMVLSSFAPFTLQIVYAVDAGPNDNDVGGEKKAATYNMHGQGALVTLVRMDNPYQENEGELDLP